MDATISPQRQTANKLVAAYEAMDVDTIESLRAPNCLRVILPRSLGLSPTDNIAFAGQLRLLLPIFQNFSLNVWEIVEDREARKVVMHLTARADTLVGEYNNEYVWFMEFDEAGEKIVSWKEFVDVGVNRDFWPKLSAARDKARNAASEKAVA